MPVLVCFLGLLCFLISLFKVSLCEAFLKARVLG